VDGDTTEITETAEPTTPEAAESVQHESEPPEQPAVSAEQLCDYIERASFGTTLGRRGYQQVDVDALLGKLSESLRAGEPLADLVRRTHLTRVRLEDGYDKSQVDDFLAAVVDLDPNA
jgi:DivIVA domain-containing protein